MHEGQISENNMKYNCVWNDEGSLADKTTKTSNIHGSSNVAENAPENPEMWHSERSLN